MNLTFARAQEIDNRKLEKKYLYTGVVDINNHSYLLNLTIKYTINFA